MVSPNRDSIALLSGLLCIRYYGVSCENYEYLSANHLEHFSDLVSLEDAAFFCAWFSGDFAPGGPKFLVKGMLLEILERS